eukprot:6185224-Pleurochrysis_carterae.AAC.4
MHAPGKQPRVRARTRRAHSQMHALTTSRDTGARVNALTLSPSLPLSPASLSPPPPSLALALSLTRSLAHSLSRSRRAQDDPAAPRDA